jgi:parallel beta-helix repeat protein
VKRFGLFIFIGYTLSGGVAHAATYYVSKAGSNSNSCAQAKSVSAPKQTINGGIACLAAGDTLFVRAGDYDEGISSIPSGSSWSAPVRIANYPGETVWLRPLVHLVGNPGGVVRVNHGEHHIEFDGINMDGRNVAYDVVAAFADGVNPDPHHIRVKNAELIAGSTDNSALNEWSPHGVLVGGHAYVGAQGGFELQNLIIHGGGRPPSGCGGSLYDNHCNGYGIYIAGPNNLVENCEIYDTSAAGIHIYNGDGDPADNNIIRNNRIHDITRTGNAGQVWGIIVIGSNNQIYNNLIYGINVGDPAEGLAAIALTRSNNKIFNNTIFNNRNSGIYLDGNASNTEIRNNIVYASTGSDFVNWGAATVQSNNLFGVNPLFVDPSAKNFQLNAASPAVNAGTLLSSVTTDLAGVVRPEGSAYDIGAYEYRPPAAASTPPTPSGLHIVAK